MATQYRCDNQARRRAVLDARDADDRPILNGIDYLEVEPDQRTLVVFFLHPLPGQADGVPAAPALAPANVRVEGGVRVTGIRVTGAEANDRQLTVTVSQIGDFSTYRLRVVASQNGDSPPPGFDPQLSAVDFSFKVECPSEFDCAPEDDCPPGPLSDPPIDYLARDYASFRRLMLDRLAVTLPGWQERNPADQVVAVIETLAYAADYLSYYQDAAATEAYLGTARRRVSVRRHARLLDYHMHDGANARAWVALEAGPAAEGALLPGPDPAANRAGALLLTKTSLPRGAISADQLARVRSEAPLCFETMHDITLHQAHNELRFYTWGDDRCCLPRGATRATLRDDAGARLLLRRGDVLILEEVRGAESGQPADADPTHRHAVRLTSAAPEARLEPDAQGQLRRVPGSPETDPLNGQPIVEIAWDAADALPFPLCLWEVEDDEIPGDKQPVAVARGNVVLADHGQTIDEPLVLVAGPRRAHARLESGPIARQCYALDRQGQRVLLDASAPAAGAISTDLGSALPAVLLRQNSELGPAWLPRRDLLNSGRFAREFVVEAEDDGRATLRFGDGVAGQRPSGSLTAFYRVGNGTPGNVGAGAIAHVVGVAGVTDVRNPLPARGGTSPEPVEQVRLYAPQAFRRQERAVTEADYAAVAQRHPEVARAVATRRWTGSWHTMFLTVDRRRGLLVDPDFEDDLRAFLERFRLAGHDLEIDGPRFVPLDIALSVCVKSGYFRSSVKAALLDRFSSRDLPGGARGFFHPDNWTFGQPVYLSQIIAAAMQIPGVQWVDADGAPPKPNRFRRWGQPAHGEIAAGQIGFGRLEIARLDNDPNAPENGRLDFLMQGGL